MLLYCFFFGELFVDAFALLGGKLKFLISYLAGLGCSSGSLIQYDNFWRGMKGPAECCNMHQTK